MKFDPPLISARLIRRYKRFLADVRLENGSETTVHCPNTGAMLGCDQPGSMVWLSQSSNPKRKYPMTWELVSSGSDGTVVGINTARTNALVEEAITAQQISQLIGYSTLRREVRVEGGRLDFLLSGAQRDCYVEVKNVTAAVEGGVALFPDARSARASRHLAALSALRSLGHRAVLLFCVQRDDVTTVKPAEAIDPDYASNLRQAHGSGVEILAYRWRVASREALCEKQITVALR